MSQEYFSSKGKSPDRSSGDAADNNSGGNRDESGEHRHTKPSYMTVGSGSTSEHAARLQALLDKDSGYGGSTVDDEAGALIPGSPAWDSATQADRPLDSSSYTNGSHHAQAGAVHQLWYNKHRVTLERSINRVIELLKGLQEKNASWPAHYPTVQRTDDPALQRPSSRPGFPHTHSMLEDLPTASPPHPGALRRSLTSLEDHAKAESSRDAEKKRLNAEPRLVTPQIAQEFSILKLDLKLGALHQTELVHSLEKNSIASLLDGKISSSIKHLLSLRERIEDRSSKVLVTGDLNAGKSTFCNAILRRKILPEDQQPCTSIFCEVLHASENNGIEEVHAVHKDAIYDRNDETTYDVFSIQDLEKLVLDNATYIQCKVYIKDIRTVDESLLNNGVVDIALIDAPGLNSDTTKTTALFARQEEIDVVVFVVSAANHFTMTAREFLLAAAAEKAYLFIVVNGFDMIRDQERCQKMILDQVRGLSPQTYKEASELVHFVSSNAIPTSPPPGGPDGGGSGSSSGGGGDDPSDDPKGKGKDKEKIRDFEVLEQSLRRFVLEKRAKSKLTPAKNYLMNILNDVNSLATVNAEVAQSEIDRVTKELEEIEPVLESNKKAKDEISAETEKIIEDTCSDVYNQTRAMINFSIAHASDPTFLDVHYPGLLSAFEYAEEVKEAMLSQIAASVTECEESARSKTVVGVNAIKQLGILHLGDEYNNLNFRPDVMFRRRRDALTRQIEIPIELWDFLDWSSLLQRQEKVAGTGMALTVATAVGGRLIGGYGWMDHALSAARIVGNDNLRRLIVPAIVVSLVAAAGYVLNQIPQSLPQRLSTKISSQLAAIDYVHANSSRIAGSVRKVLRFPADSLREGLQRSVEQLGGRREETLKVRAESAVALKYFSNLVRDSAHQRAAVGGIDLDGHPPGLAH